MEEWRNIKGYEGLYQISNYGRVRSSYKGVWNILKPIDNGKGYKHIKLFKGGKRKPYYIHRLVAQTFIDNPNNYTEVNHIDENKENNHMDNLEWCNREYNLSYNLGIKRRAESRKGKCVGIKNCMYGRKGEVHPASKKVKCITTGEIFGSVKEAANKYNIHPSNITKCCKGNLKTAAKMEWEYFKGGGNDGKEE